MKLDLQEHTHRRLNPLTGEWILVSPHRAKRPWQGKQEAIPPKQRPEYDPTCYLCPGNTRASGETNPSYTGLYTFTNDFAALVPEVPAGETLASTNLELFVAHAERGTCTVVCFSPRHDLTIAGMDTDEIEGVVIAWRVEYESLGRLDYVSYVQIFENKGAIMGCSNPHPHGQIWANETIPVLPELETHRQRDYLRSNASCLLCDYLQIELAAATRIVFENHAFAAVVPFWSVWPFEAMILPKRHRVSLSELDTGEVTDLADAIRRLCVRYDRLFDTDFPYSMGLHQAPTDEEPAEGWHFHLHYFPPLLRSATVKKFMVGYEMLAMPQRDITAEMSAERLRALADDP